MRRNLTVQIFFLFVECARIEFVSKTPHCLKRDHRRESPKPLLSLVISWTKSPNVLSQTLSKSYGTLYLLCLPKRLLHEAAEMPIAANLYGDLRSKHFPHIFISIFKIILELVTCYSKVRYVFFFIRQIIFSHDSLICDASLAISRAQCSTRSLEVHFAHSPRPQQKGMERTMHNE